MAAAARAQRFLTFVNASASPFHAVDTCRQALVSGGFQELSEMATWSLERGGKYFFTRNQSTIVAFVVGGEFGRERPSGFKVLGAHTDSPCLRVRPVSSAQSQGYLQVGVQLYGGGLWHTWFDRDLAFAGRAIVARGDTLEQRLVHVKRPVLRIPNLAIHLQSADERAAFKINTETHLQPVIATAVREQLGASAGDRPRHWPVLLELISRELDVPADAIRDFELSLCDTQPAALLGAREEFISSPRLDNLLSSFCGLEALLEAAADAAALQRDPDCRVLACFDHEEIGSESVQGAASLLMESSLNRILTGVPGAAAAPDAFAAAMRRSFMISSDMAHAVHPNYPEKHQEAHRPQMHRGPVIKHNANQRYATDSVSATVLREVARRADVPMQEFVVRNDSPCGSTIGPLLSARTGIKTVDIGVPQLSMHSIREICGVDDVDYAVRLFKAFWSDFEIPESLTRA